MRRIYLATLLGALLPVAFAMTAPTRVQAKGNDSDDQMITLSGCVQGYTQGGYFLSDSKDFKNGKPKHYLLINDNDEVKTHTGKWVEVVGWPAEIGWVASIKTPDNRKLKTAAVFGVDAVTVVRESCS